MFTGIIETTGTILAAKAAKDSLVISVSLPKSWRVKRGQSIAVDGGCLTVTAFGGGWAEFFLGPETLKKTIAGGYKKNSVVNLERAAKLGGRLDGHLVQGHVDETAKVLACGRDGEAYRLVLALPAGARALTIPQGSITINGVSLTIAKLTTARLEIMLIPESWRVTNLSRLRPGDRVNLEYDLIGKYVMNLQGIKSSR
jgi:riboflavin synthase